MLGTLMAALLWGLPLETAAQSQQLWLSQQDASAPWQQYALLTEDGDRSLALIIASRLSLEPELPWQQAQLLMAAQQQSWPQRQIALSRQYQQQRQWLNSGAGQHLNRQQRQRWLLMQWLVEELQLLEYHGPQQQQALSPQQVDPQQRYLPRWGGS
ncbi:hypothetical protein [Ferrimonas senticii]|uniref:hypothetical protein n=1 Tax=Ferrimonas senticii TaxID=394566 RepID=UPI0003FFC112|nr:hypothetical protein [Ferrimonas senticii]